MSPDRRPGSSFASRPPSAHPANDEAIARSAHSPLHHDHFSGTRKRHHVSALQSNDPTPPETCRCSSLAQEHLGTCHPDNRAYVRPRLRTRRWSSRGRGLATGHPGHIQCRGRALGAAIVSGSQPMSRIFMWGWRWGGGRQRGWLRSWLQRAKSASGARIRDGRGCRWRFLGLGRRESLI